ncbi:hypothetical protein CF319_g7716 [Tilletia indica]|nr:hypothetical protein CF319_g7716 [Tilletia indica]
MITDFPNLFMVMTGFNVGTGHSSNVYTAECQIEWTIRTGRDLFDERSRPSKAELEFGGETERAGVDASGSRKRFPWIEPKREAQVKEMLWFQEKMQDFVFSGACGAWYVDPSSGVVAAICESLSPFLPTQALKSTSGVGPASRSTMTSCTAIFLKIREMSTSLRGRGLSGLARLWGGVRWVSLRRSLGGRWKVGRSSRLGRQ